MSHTTILTDKQSIMYSTALDVSIEANILDITGFSDELLDVLNEMIQVEQAKRSYEAKELKYDEMRAEAQADWEQYEKELEESNQI